MIANHRLAFDEFRRAVEHEVRYANISIIEGIGASQYGIGIVAAVAAHWGVTVRATAKSVWCDFSH